MISVNKIITFLIISILLVFTTNNSNGLKQPMQKYNYEEAWKKVADFESQGLPESALKVVNEIYLEAKKEKNTPQLVKAVIHQLKFVSLKEEDALIKNLLRVEKEIGIADFPVKPLLHSMLAEMYWKYYENNRWKFQNRTQTENFDQNDINTWTLTKIIETTSDHYKQSLEYSEKSMQTDLSSIEKLIHSGNERGRSYRPTLYDFLAHRALDFFMGEEPSITQPVYAFKLNQEQFIKPAKDFINLTISEQDTLSLKYQAIKIFQELTRLHIDDNTPESLVDIEIKRLKFVKEHLTLSDKEQWYVEALEKLESEYLSHPISAFVTYEIAQQYFTWGQKYQPLQSGKYQWDLKKAHELCEQAIKRFPDSFGADHAKALQNTIKNKTISAEVEKVNYPEQPFRALVRYRNFSEMSWRAVSVSVSEIKSVRDKWKDRSDQEQKFIEHFLEKKPEKTGKVTLPTLGDFQEHSSEIKLDGLKEGLYIIFLSHKSDFKTEKNGIAYVLTNISKISYISKNTNAGRTDFYVLDRMSGAPLEGVSAHLFWQKYNYKTQRTEKIKGKVYKSDKNGLFTVPYIYDREKRNFSLDFYYKEDTLMSIDTWGNVNSPNFYQYKVEKPKSRRQTFFFLDRAIYRPGQTIYFKGMVLETDGEKPEIKADYRTVVRLFDVNHQEVAKTSFVTNRYGTFSGSFVAPSTGLTGQMRLQTLDHSGQTYFSVEEYKRPKFEVAFDPVKGAFRLNDSIKVIGKAKAYSGANISDAAVQYRIVREAIYPYWYWGRYSYSSSTPEVEIVNGTTSTDKDGSFSVDFKAIPDETTDKSASPSFTYTVYADVTDINGETQSHQTSIRVGYTALELSLQIPDLDKNKKEINDKSFPLRSTNLAGEFEAAKGQLVIYPLKSPRKAYRKRLWQRPDQFVLSGEEFRQYFPHDVYKDEDNYMTWEREKAVYSEKFDTEIRKEVNLDAVKKWPIGRYVVEITSRDRYGSEVKAMTYFTIFDSKGNKIPYPDYLYVKEVNVNVKPGGTACLLAGTSLGNTRVLYEVEKGGELLSQKWLTFDKNQTTLEIPVTEAYRGNIVAHLTFIRHDRVFSKNVLITVPYSNKDLQISFETFRNKLLPGEKEQWKLKIKGEKADVVAAEMVATLYDASLDVFRPNSWLVHLYNYRYARQTWRAGIGFNAETFQVFNRSWNEIYYAPDEIYYDRLNWFGFDVYGRSHFKYRMRGAALSMSVQETAIEEVVMESADMEENESDKLLKDGAGKPKEKKEESQGKEEGLSEVKVRKNFNETAFFYPHLQTNETGEIIINFTIPEALTRWKMLGFAHTTGLKHGMTTNELITQKELMVVPNPPRFFRENDKMTFSTKIVNLTENELSGDTRLEFFDALTMKSIDGLMKNKNTTQKFAVAGGGSTGVSWDIEIPEGVQAITYRIVAKSGSFSDGEEMVIPVVTNRMLVTETLPLPIRGNQTKNFTFDKLANNSSKTLKNHRLSLEFTSNPAWYAVQALPYLMEYPYECTEQVFSRFYANAMATHIANSNPKIKRVFDTWKSFQPDALLSNLEKNQALKSALLEETPWVLQAKDETQRKRAIGVLFDLNRMSNEMAGAVTKIVKAQTPNGGFSWFPGFPESRYITQHIVSGMGHLDVLKVNEIRKDQRVWRMVKSAVGFMDDKMYKDYEELKRMAKEGHIKLEDDHLSYLQIHYLYARSYFIDIAVHKRNQEAYNYFIGQAKKYWLRNNRYMEGMIALALKRLDGMETPDKIIASLKERALHSEEMGMYWKTTHGYYWYQAPIETQALMIEVFDEVANDPESVEDLKVWLLKQKQTQDWKTTKATTEACYALLLRGTDALSQENLVSIKIGEKKVNARTLQDTQVEAGTGYFKKSWSGGEINSDMGKITVSKENEGVAWGAVYWQYFEQLDKITPAKTPLAIKKQLFLQKNTDRGPVITPIENKTELKVGDLVKVRIELRVDRNMEYIHLKDMRAAGFEPVNTISTHKYQDGLWYYENTRDLATNFFMERLYKGSYVFEYSLRVAQKGDFSNGITTIQSMYAPEFTSHSEGVRVKIK